MDANYIDKVRRQRLKKGQPKRFRRGNLVKVVAPSKAFLSELVALWNTHPHYDRKSGMVGWSGEVRINSHVNQKDILLILDVHNLPHPNKHQYCHVTCFRTHESGWVSSESLEKL